MMDRGVHQTAYDVMRRLAELGYGRQMGDRLYNVRFRRVIRTDSWLVLEVDTRDLPPSCRLNGLGSEATTHDLTAHLGQRVHCLNTHGVTYAIERNSRRHLALPKRIPLVPQSRPPGDYMIPIGYGHRGPVWRSLVNPTSHILVGGTTQYGKSTWLNAMLISLVFNEDPALLNLVLIDPKAVEFQGYWGIPHLAFDIATEPDEAEAALAWVVDEMNRRKDVFRQAGAHNLAAYNQASPVPLPLIVVVVDEVTTLAMDCGPSFQHNLTNLVHKAASFGIVVVVASQNPKAEVMNSLAKGNFATRISFWCPDWQMAKVILGETGAEKLSRTPGRLKARLDGGVVELQGYYVHPSWTHKLGHLKRGDIAVPPPPKARLTPLQAEMVTYALNNWGGKMPQEQLYQAFKGRISHNAVVKMLRQWEDRGWLLKTTDGRIVTPALYDILEEAVTSKGRKP